MPLVRSSQPNNHQTVYGKQIVKRNVHIATPVTNGVQQRSSPVRQHPKVVVIQPSANRNSPAENSLQKTLPKTIINPPLVTASSKSSSPITKVSSESFKIPPVFVQQSSQSQPEKSQNQNVQYLMKNSNHTTHSNQSSLAAAVNSTTPQNQNALHPQQPQNQMKIQNPPPYGSAISNRAVTNSSSNLQGSGGTTKPPAYMLPNQQSQQSHKQQSNVIQQYNNVQVNNENVANHNFQQIKTNASISNGKIVYTIPVNSNNPGLNQEKISVAKKSCLGKPAAGKKKNNLNDGYQSKDIKVGLLPVKSGKLNGVLLGTSARSSPTFSQSFKKKKLHKSYSSSSQEPFPVSKVGNVVTEPATSCNKEWHAPDTYIYDYIGPCTDLFTDADVTACTQQHWFYHDSSKMQNGLRNSLSSTPCFSSADSNSRNCDNNDFRQQLQSHSRTLTRDQRLHIKKTNLRRQNIQHWSAQNLRTTKLAQQRLMSVAKILEKLNLTKDEL